LNKEKDSEVKVGCRKNITTSILAITFFLTFLQNFLKTLSTPHSVTNKAHKRIGTSADKKILKNSVDFPKKVTSKLYIMQSNESNITFP